MLSLLSAQSTHSLHALTLTVVSEGNTSPLTDEKTQARKLELAQECTLSGDAGIRTHIRPIQERVLLPATSPAWGGRHGSQ